MSVEWLLGHAEQIIGVVLAIAGAIWGRSRVQAVMAERRVKMLLQLAEWAFVAVDEWYARSGPPGDDKAKVKRARYLAVVREALAAMRRAGLSADEVAVLERHADHLNAVDNTVEGGVAGIMADVAAGLKKK